MEWEGSLLPLFWILLLTFFVQIVVTLWPWIRLPSILGYILLGMFIGNNHFHAFNSEQIHWIMGLGQFGLFYLMFLSGMEIDLQLLRFRKGARMLDNPLVIGILLFMGSLALSLGFGLQIQHMDPHIQPWMIMLILSTTSLGIVMPVLKESKLLKTNYGQILLTSALLADLITMIILSVTAGSYHTGFTWRQAAVGLLLPLLVICYQLASFVRVTSLWKKQFSIHPTVKLQAVFAILGLFGVITDLSDSEPILGSFLAGMLLSSFRLNDNSQLKQQLEVIGYGFIIPIFFVFVGASFSLTQFIASPQALAWVPVLVISAFFVKIIPMLWIGQSLGLRRSLAGGFLLSSRLTLVVVAATIGQRIGVITADFQDAILVVAMITSLLSPIIFNVLQKKAKF